MHQKDLALRKIQYLNIAFDKGNSSNEFDTSQYKSESTGRGPLNEKDWAKTHHPIMCCYKLVSVKFQVFGLQSKVENMIDQVKIRLAFRIKQK